MALLITIVSGFASGVFLRSLFSYTWEPILFSLLAAALCAVFFYVKPHVTLKLGAIALCFFALGVTRMAFAESPLPSVFTEQLGERVQYEGIVVADPDMRDASQRVHVRVTQNGESTTMLAVAPRYPSVAAGDRVFVSGTLALPEPFADDGGRVFRYDKYLERDGVRFLLNFAYIRVESSAPWYSPRAALARVKHSFLEGITATLPEPHASLASGIVIGGRSGLGSELKEGFILSGLIHIIVLSGYNVMVVAEWVMATLALTALPRRWSAIFGALALLVFVAIAGFSTTAVRAAIMALIALYARATGRTYVAGRSLLLVVLLMLVWNPLYLVFDPGFSLSIAATAGLIWLAPLIERRLSFIRSIFSKTWLQQRLLRKLRYCRFFSTTRVSFRLSPFPQTLSPCLQCHLPWRFLHLPVLLEP
jgi:competence protein ComEC